MTSFFPPSLSLLVSIPPYLSIIYQEKMDGYWMDAWMDRHMDGQRHGWTDVWMIRPTQIQLQNYHTKLPPQGRLYPEMPVKSRGMSRDY